MPIHHDKAIYGKLVSMQEAVSDDAVAKMAQELIGLEELETESAENERRQEKWAKVDKKNFEKQ